MTQKVNIFRNSFTARSLFEVRSISEPRFLILFLPRILWRSCGGNDGYQTRRPNALAMDDKHLQPKICVEGQQNSLSFSLLTLHLKIPNPSTLKK
jgi:hypothetical protein